jgi:DNA adenine methylase
MATLTPYRYPGSKAKLVSTLMEYIDPLLVGKHEFCDLFIGGGSVLLEVAKKYPHIGLYANDKDKYVASFWQIIADTNSNNLNKLLGLMETKPTLKLFYKLRETPANDIVGLAYRSIFFNRTTFSGIFNSGPIGGKNQSSKYSVDCRYNFKKLKEKILNCHKLLSGRAVIDNVDFSEYLILSHTDIPVYIDAPYYNKGDILYHEKMSSIQHQLLAQQMENRPNWVMSYDDCSEIRQLYSSKKIIDLSARYCINGKKDNWQSKNELVILGD